MKPLTDNAILTFRSQLATLKALTGMNNEALAELLGCSKATVSHLYNDPFSVNGRLILLVQEHLRKEEKRRYE